MNDRSGGRPNPDAEDGSRVELVRVLVATLGLDWLGMSGQPDGIEVAEDCADALIAAGIGCLSPRGGGDVMRGERCERHPLAPAKRCMWCDAEQSAERYDATIYHPRALRRWRTTKPQADLPHACCPHCGCGPSERIGHDDTCRMCPDTAGAPTLTEFLLARIAEDEKRATLYHGLLCMRIACDAECCWGQATDEEIAAERICTCGYPARVLAECAAKREAVLIAERGLAAIGEGSPHRSLRSGRVHDSAGILCALAAVYEDHPDYDEEWRP